jgi:enoyl-CoA hydratase
MSVDSLYFPLSDQESVVMQTVGSVAHIVLNRPKALNALNLDMIRSITPKLKDWANAPHISAVVIRGVGGKSFCAGGDVRALYDEKLNSGNTKWEMRKQFFKEEYILNRLIAAIPQSKPYIAILDGITSKVFCLKFFKIFWNFSGWRCWIIRSWRL